MLRALRKRASGAIVMRMSQLFGRTLRDVPADVETPGHGLLLRAGLIRQLAAGIYQLLPLGRMAQDRLEGILREEMAAIGGQEVSMPVVHPAELWARTGRLDAIGSELTRLTDRNDRPLVLAMTHEETVAELCRTEIESWRQLPRLIFHIQTKWRDDARPRAGLIRAREFTMLDSYSLDADEAGLDAQYEAHDRAYKRIFDRCGLPVVAVDADPGVMGGASSREYMVLAPSGEDTVLSCPSCGHAANRQVATFAAPPPAPDQPLPVERLETPDCATIAELAAFLDIPESATAKVIFLVAAAPTSTSAGGAAAERVVMAVVRGDRVLSETKIARVLGVGGLRPAHEEEIRAVGAEPGYASPVGLSAGPGLAIVVDPLVANSPNLVGGANEAGLHLGNLNYGRDFSGQVEDITAARGGDPCPACGTSMDEQRGIEVGNIFKLGTRYSTAVGANYLAADGKRLPVVMGSYGIGVGRTLQCVAELHHDDQGLVWPASVAPLDVHLIALPGGEEMAEEAYAALSAAGIPVLLDDRDERPGVKFNDADLIGLPIRLTAGRRGAQQGGLELKLRSEPEARADLLPRGSVADDVASILAELMAEPARRATTRT